MEHRFRPCFSEVPSDTWTKHVGYRVTEGAAERKIYWLSAFVSPKNIENMKNKPLYKSWSKERLILESMQGAFEKEVSYDPTSISRLQALLPFYRAIAFFNMNAQEQAELETLAQQTKAAEIVTQITEEQRQDIRWIWSTFRLRQPNVEHDISIFIKS